MRLLAATLMGVVALSGCARTQPDSDKLAALEARVEQLEKQLADEKVKVRLDDLARWSDDVTASLNKVGQYLSKDFVAGDLLDKADGHKWVTLSAIERLLVADECRHRMRANGGRPHTASELMTETDRIFFGKPGLIDLKNSSIKDVLALSDAALDAKREQSTQQ